MPRSATVLACAVLVSVPCVRAAHSQEAAPLPAQPAAATEPGVAGPHTAEPGHSEIRIVRVSQARGEVQMDRNTGRGFEPAFANIPVVRGVRLRTLRGVAEVEFEDNSSLRLAPESEIVFEGLGRDASGATDTTVRITRGLLYVSLAKTRGNTFLVERGPATVSLEPAARLRLEAQPDQAEIVLLSGAADVRMGNAEEHVGKRQTLVLNTATQSFASVTSGFQEADWDAWDQQGVEYHKLRANAVASAGAGFYGVNDLEYYGSYSDLPGCGSVWRPYFASTAWDPFATGIWAWYPSAGFSWVSPYPWGWLPYHSGTWVSCGTAGWGWRPGGSWHGLANQQVLHIPHQPLPRPVPPLPGRPTLFQVSLRPAPVSGMASPDHFTFRRDSAGLGVPRSNFGNLRHMEGNVERHGEVTSGFVTNTVAGPMHTDRADELGFRHQEVPAQAMHREGGSVVAGRRDGSELPVSNGLRNNAGNASAYHGGTDGAGGTWSHAHGNPGGNGFTNYHSNANSMGAPGSSGNAGLYSGSHGNSGGASGWHGGNAGGSIGNSSGAAAGGMHTAPATGGSAPASPK